MLNRHITKFGPAGRLDGVLSAKACSRQLAIEDGNRRVEELLELARSLVAFIQQRCDFPDLFDPIQS